MSNLVWLSVLCALLFVVDITRSATLYSSVPATTATAPAPGNPETDQTKVKPASLDVSETGLHISLCTSCQYVGQYNKIKEVINQELPGIEVSYSEYPVTFMKSLLGYVIMAVQYAIIAVAIGGERVLAYLNIPMNDFIKGMMVSTFLTWIVHRFLHDDQSLSLTEL